MSIGIWQILLIVALVVLLFGRNKISDLMGDVAKGIKSFKKGMAEDDSEEPRTIDHDVAEPMTAKTAPEKENTKAG
ncbi:MAG: twin-arginine translocase TatA/TatE family subunit [Propylenella sp.]